jgi:4a-hydroxytetrahydrobiopterin dehydratase
LSGNNEKSTWILSLSIGKQKPLFATSKEPKTLDNQQLFSVLGYSFILVSEFMWVEKDNKLTRSYTFPDFKSAFGFMVQVAFLAEKMNHHPWWSNVYNQVSIELNTHDAGNVVTEKDWKLARAIDELMA